MISIIGVVAVIGAVIAFTFLSPMNQPTNIDQQAPPTQSPASLTPPIPTDNTEQIVTNQPPVANDQSVTTDVNKPVDIRLTASDLDKNDRLIAKTVALPSHGTLSDINQDTGVVTYTPNPGFTGTDSFTFNVNDGKVDSNKQYCWNNDKSTANRTV